MTAKIPRTVVHYGRNDPNEHTGGVETFARNLGLVFDEVQFMTPKRRDMAEAMRRGWLVICDNQLVVDWPEEYPVIGFQHGVARVKFGLTRNWSDARLAWGQARAARRPATFWVACARWISDTFRRLQGNGADEVVYHIVDVDRFDGCPAAAFDPRLVLHDARTEHKGKRLVERLARELPGWRFEPLACRPPEVPDRMRRGRAFLHLSRYEGNSIVCNEAMAMDLPCLFTRVGLMRDRGHDFDVWTIDPALAFGDRRRLVDEVRAFLESIERRSYSPRRWVLEHATLEANRAGWQRVVDRFEARFGGRLQR